MNTQQQESQEPRLCANGCGFFANTNCGELCSKCGREAQANQAAAKAIASSGPAAMPPVSQCGPTTQLLPVPHAAAQPQLAAAQPTLPTQSPAAPADPPALPAEEAAISASAAPAQQPLSPKVLEAVSAAAEAVSGQGSSAAQQAAADDGAEEGPPRRVQKNTNRCFSCNKKIGLTGFSCRCGYVFCGPHRLAEAHDCDFDYKGAGRESLAKANPLVQADRVARF